MTYDGMGQGAVQLSVLAMDAACQPDPAQTGQRIVDLAAKLIPCVAVDIVSRGPRPAPHIIASSDQQINNQLAAALRQWPHDPYPEFGDESVDSSAARATGRHPAGYWQHILRSTGVAAELIFSLRVGQSQYGFLRFLLRDSVQPGSTQDLLCAAFAAHAAIALDRAALQETVGNLLTAIVSNREIGAAVGILMAHGGINYDQGFQLLKSASQNNNRKLREVVNDVLYTGQLPDDRLRHHAGGVGRCGAAA